MGDLGQFKTGLEQFGPIIVQLPKHNGHMQLWATIQEKMNQPRIIHKLTSLNHQL